MPVLKLEEKTRFIGATNLAKKCGVTQPFISLILHGRRKPGEKLAAKLKKLGVTIPPFKHR